MRRFPIVLVPLFLFSLVSLDTLAAAAEPTASIAGTATDGGKPVAGALVAAIAMQSQDAAVTARSDAQGRFRLGPLLPGKYGVTATASGHTAGFTLGVAAAAGAVARTEVKLGGAALAVSGTVVDDLSGQPLSGAKLLAARESEVEGDLFAIEVPSGSYQVLLPQGKYTLIASAPGHAVQRQPAAEGAAAVTLRLPRSWPPGPAPTEVVDWMRAHAIPLSGVEAGHGAADLQPLAAALGEARLIGLGEATHGSREFFQLKHRLLEWLVSERGFNVFAIEATMPEAFAINEYVLTGRGDPQKALAGLYFWTWNTEEVLDLIRWMRKWNSDPRHPKVKFYGFDMRQMPRAVQVALAYIERVEKSEAASWATRLAPLANALDARAAVSEPAELPALAKDAAALVERFDAARAAWTARSSAKAWAIARQHARLLVQSLEVLSLGQAPAAGERRDQAMAENISWIAEHEGPQSKVVVWAHDFHVSYGSPSWHPMGQFLRTRWGKAYLNVGFAFDHGDFRSGDRQDNDRVHPFTVEPLPPGTFDATLNATGLPRFILDLRNPPAGTVADWLGAQHGKREITEAFNPKWPSATSGLPGVTAREFDLIAFIAQTAAARSLPEGSGGDRSVLPEPLNLGFEELDGDKVRGFSVLPLLPAFGYSFSATAEKPLAGARCALLRRLPGPHYGQSVGEFLQRIDAKPYRGKRVRLVAAVRAKVAAGSSARLTLQVRPGGPGTLNFMRDSPIVDAHWKTYSLELAVPAGAAALAIGGALVGDGAACFDDFRLEIIPLPGPPVDPIAPVAPAPPVAPPALPAKP
ncbi:MAG TPA: erythromycin esterase family protein [Pseudomonadota bacterium]|nr:erythromycin esterase family protein [Pseudomonadota bacterium]